MPAEKGSRYQRLKDPSKRRVASTSARWASAGHARGKIEHDADPPSRVAPQDVNGAPVREQHVVGDAERFSRIPVTRRLLARLVTEMRDAPRLVVGHPVRHTIAEPFATTSE